MLSRRDLLALLPALAGRPRRFRGFEFAIVGDRSGSPVAGVYEQTVREVAALKPDFVINVGDTISARTPASVEAEWARIRRLWQAQGGDPPLYFTAGNHDIFSPETRKLYEKYTGRPATYGFDWGGAHFTVLDNSAGWELGSDQLDFLDADLRAAAPRPGGGPRFVFFHQPFWIFPLKLGNGEFRLHQLALKFGVKWIFSGHGHQFLCLEREGVTYTEIGSSGAYLRGKKGESGMFYHFVRGRVEAGGRVAFTVHELGAPNGTGRRFPLQAGAG